MADEPTAAAPAGAPVPVPGGILDLTPPLEMPDMGAIVAELEAMPPEETGEVTPPVGEATPASEAETPAPVVAPKPVEPAAEPEAEAESVRAARAILASANKKARLATEAVPKAKAETEAELITQFRSDPASFFARAGLTEEAQVQAWFKRFSGQAETPAATEPPEPRWAKELRERNESLASQAQDQQVAQLTRTVVETVSAAADKFPLIAAEKAADKVPAKMIAYHKHHGKPCSIEHAAKLVERDLRAAGKKVPSAGTPVTAPATKPNSTRPGSVTMTNSETRGQPPTGDLPDDPDARLRAVTRELEALER